MVRCLLAGRNCGKIIFSRRLSCLICHCIRWWFISPSSFGSILPFVALGLAWAIRKERIRQKMWVAVTALALMYGATAWVAAELGEEDEDKVEKVIAEEVIEEHEEAGERIPGIAGALLVVSLAGLWLRHARKGPHRVRGVEFCGAPAPGSGRSHRRRAGVQIRRRQRAP